MGENDFTIVDRIVVDYMKHTQTEVIFVSDVEGDYQVVLGKA